MAGLIDKPVTGAIGVEAQGTEAVPSSYSETEWAIAETTFGNAFDTLRLGRLNTELGVDPNTGMPIPTGKMLDPDQANDRFGIEGRLKWTAPVPEDVAQEQRARMHESIVREDVIRRNDLNDPNGPDKSARVGPVMRFAAGLAGGLPGIVDPVNIAASFIPFVPEARAAIWAARGGIAAKAGIGAIQGAGGQALLTPLQYGLSRAEGEDMSATDALLNIALGGIFGGGLHTGAALLGRAGERTALALDRAPPEAREDLLRGAVADLAEGRPVESPNQIVQPPCGTCRRKDIHRPHAWRRI